MRRTFPKGITLIETVLYVGLLAITLPFMVQFLLRTQSEHQLFDARMRMEQSAALLLDQLTYDLTKADNISVSTSTLNSATSTFKFHDDSGTLITIDCPTVNTTFESGSQNVRRLRYQSGANAAIYLTDNNLDVTQWRIVAVRDSSNILTGIRVSFDVAMLAPDGSPYRNAAFAANTTISLQPHTVEN